VTASADSTLVPLVCVIAETDPFIGRLLQRFAEESGLQTACANVGQEVVDLVRTAHPVVIVLEAELPGKMRGWEAARALRACEETCRIPIISCSWLAEADARALVGEIAGHLQKPEFYYDDFVTALKQAGVDVRPQVKS
jgi:CheY-like chemotaxis protein